MEPLVVYIIGDVRSGSTLLDYLLSCHPNAISVGELHNLYGYYYNIGPGKMYGWKCSCGEPVKDCEFWKDILNDISFSSFYKTRLRVKGPKTLPLSDKKIEDSLNNILKSPKNMFDGEAISNNIWRIYKAIAEHSNKSIIIDSSKNALHAFYLNKYRKGKIRFLLMDRRIEEVAYSKLNRLKQLKPYYSIKNPSIFKCILGSFRSSKINRFIIEKIQEDAKVDIVKKIDYIKMAEKSQETIDEVCKFLGIAKFISPKRTNEYDSVIHIIGGSPSRYHKRLIAPDNRWEKYYRRKPFAALLARSLQSLLDRYKASNDNNK